MKLIKGEFKEKLDLKFAPSIKAGSIAFFAVLFFK